jgi:hypothetical protein
MTTKNVPQRTKCEIYTRVMGYYRPVSQFNIGKQSEFEGRIYFTEKTNEKPLIQTKNSSLFSQAVQ